MKKFYYLMLTTLLVLLASFETKAQSTDTEQEKVKVTINYTNEDARKAVEMIFNVTQLRSIAYEGIDNFEVYKGDKVRFVFNAKDYDITFDNDNVTPSSSYPENSPYLVTVTEDVTYTISATNREYGTTNIMLWANDIEGLVLHEGQIDGPVIDGSNIMKIGTTEYTFGSIKSKKTATLNIYSITVSAKSPKVFVSEAEGYWIEASEYSEETDYMTAAVSSNENILRVLCNKLVNDTRLVVYLSVDGTNVPVENVTLRDNNRKDYTLVQGYNEFMIDSRYSNEFTAAAYSNTSATSTFSYYCNRRIVTMDNDTQQYTANVSADAILHIFAGRPAPTQCTVTADISPNATATANIIVDHFDTITKDNPSVTTFKGCEVSVTPGDNSYTLDGIVPEYEGDTHTFSITGNHNIVLDVATGMNSINANANNKVNVTTIDGRVILNNADINTVNTLPSGIYIVNGKKLIK